MGLNKNLISGYERPTVYPECNTCSTITNQYSEAELASFAQFSGTPSLVCKPDILFKIWGVDYRVHPLRRIPGLKVTTEDGTIIEAVEHRTLNCPEENEV